jgi:hypothetical protein
MPVTITIAVIFLLGIIVVALMGGGYDDGDDNTSAT